jgi:tetratricopeptide (TPR) repeat protein
MKTYDAYTAEYFLKRAVARMESKEFRSAYEDFSTAFKLIPEYADGHYEYSRFKYLTLKDKNEAINEINKALEINPDDARYYARRAEYKAHVAKFDYDGENILKDAVKDMNTAINLDADNVDYRAIRSSYNKELGEPEDAIEDYDVMISINPDRVEVYTERGLIEMQNDQYTEAISDFTKSIELQPNKEYNYRYRGLCRHNILDFGGAYNDYSKSIQLIEEALKTSEDSVKLKKILADTYVKRGAAATSMGNTYNSCADFRTAYELGSRIGLNYLRKYCGI